MISRDPDAVRPGSQTAKRIAGYAAMGAEVTVVLFASLPRFLPVLWRGLTTVRRGWIVTAQDPFESGKLAWIIARLRGAKLELQVHGDFFNPAWAAEAWHRPLRLALARFRLSNADGVRAVSKRVARSLQDIVPADRITIIPVAVQPAAPNATPIDASEVRYAGRFTSEKNLSMLIRAFATAASAHPAARLVLVGDGPEMPRVRAAIKASGVVDRIRIDPWTNGPAIGAAGIIAIPSLHESWSRLAIEAALAGRAIVMTDVGCAGEVIVDGESGWVVSPGNEAAFAAALTEALSNPDEARRRGENARRAAAALPDAEETARRIVAAWERLVRVRRITPLRP